ncbi:MAG: bifunctional (p)ppGpp synthetase/guanosine-3',5'-bis(diphosphate) 3'-pyrophosphohydrolase [Burkholderiaceae bacterium]
MKTGMSGAAAVATPSSAAIVALAGEAESAGEAGLRERARAFAAPLLAGQQLETGESSLPHADAVAVILHSIGAPPAMCAAAYLVQAADHLTQPEEVVCKAFGASQASLVANTRRLMQAQRTARAAQLGQAQRAQQLERVRKMLLAFSRDLRVVLLRLASRLATLRHYAASRQPCPGELAAETLQVFAPLANRLGIWQVKWELEDLAFRFLEPQSYRHVAQLLDARRVERERQIEALRCALADDLARVGVRAQVQGRPKHLYSIWKKMNGKAIAFDAVLDVRALRVIVGDVADCYKVLGRVQERYRAVAGEFDDYIARPKPNGYQSLHTVVQADDGAAVEIQIRTREMHEHAEHGVAAHWAYKEAGARGYAGVSAGSDADARVAEARKAVLHQLLAWERDLAEQGSAEGPADPQRFDDRIYVFTPQATLVELTAGATPIDFAYALHTELGHRCRGARVDGAMLPLNTVLRSGQTVEIVGAKEGGPSLDWLNAELGYLRSPRSRAKVRAWFNLAAQHATVARGREAVEKLLQRSGRTALKLDALAAQLQFRDADAMFEAVGKDELSLRAIELVLRPAETPPTPDELTSARLNRAPTQVPSGVLVVGVESLLTTLARCCRPAPPDPIGGYITRGKGVSIHRLVCPHFKDMAQRAPERVSPVAWGASRADRPAAYPVDVIVEAADRQGLLRDISEIFAKEKMNVIGVHTQSVRSARGETAWMTFTVEVANAQRLAQVLGQVAQVDAVRHARRR